MLWWCGWWHGSIGEKQLQAIDGVNGVNGVGHHWSRWPSAWRWSFTYWVVREVKHGGVRGQEMRDMGETRWGAGDWRSHWGTGTPGGRDGGVGAKVSSTLILGGYLVILLYKVLFHTFVLNLVLFSRWVYTWRDTCRHHPLAAAAAAGAAAASSAALS